MMHCTDIRTEIAVAGTDSTLVQEHIHTCDACRAYATRNHTLDLHISRSLTFTPSPQLTQELLAIARDHAKPVQRQRRWYDAFVVLVVGVVALMTSVLIAAEIVVYFTGPYGFGSYASEVVALPAQVFTWMSQVMPFFAQIMLSIDTMRMQLVVILLALLGILTYTNQRAKRNRL